MTTALLILHGLVAVALLGAITHQALAAWAPAGGRPRSFFGRFRTVRPVVYADAVVALYVAAALLGAIVYLSFKVDIQPYLERDRHWSALGVFDLKEDFVAIGFGLLPAYWVSWRWPFADEPSGARAALTTLLGLIVWWAFLVGHVVNDIMGFGS
jgi:hypothetical protein